MPAAGFPLVWDRPRHNMTEDIAAEAGHVEDSRKHQMKRQRVFAEVLEETHVEPRDLEALDVVVVEASSAVSSDEECELCQFKVYAVEVITTTYYVVRCDVDVDVDTVDYTLNENKQPKLYYTTRAGRKSAFHLLPESSRPVLGEMERVSPDEAGISPKQYQHFNALMETMPPGKLASRMPGL